MDRNSTKSSPRTRKHDHNANTIHQSKRHTYNTYGSERDSSYYTNKRHYKDTRVFNNGGHNNYNTQGIYMNYPDSISKKPTRYSDTITKQRISKGEDLSLALSKKYNPHGHYNNVFENSNAYQQWPNEELLTFHLLQRKPPTTNIKLDHDLRLQVWDTLINTNTSMLKENENNHNKTSLVKNEFHENNIVVEHKVATTSWIIELGDLFPKISSMYNTSLQYYNSCLVEI